VLKTQLTEKFAPYFESSKNRTAQSYFVFKTPPRLPAELSRVIEAIELPGPITYHITSSTPPFLAYDHMEVPDDVARDMDALKAHSRMITGQGINLAMVDSGFMTPFHPYYIGKGYNIQPVVADPADQNPNDDLIGHGTAMAACALAVAPGVTFTVYKLGDNWPAAFSRAVMNKPHIITNSWEIKQVDTSLQMAVNNAVASGIVVLFSCGNLQAVAWPGSEPAVISVGGAFVDVDDTIQASSYASSGTNSINPNRQCPDLCGITGQAPLGIFIALPTQPNSGQDQEFSGGIFPNGDETKPDDGWIVVSGTSSATPMVAGVAALLMQANPALKGNPSAVRGALSASCLDVKTGTSGNGQPAGPGTDLATGAGLVQAYRAVNNTDIWIKDNPDSDIGLVPTHNRRPSWPPFAHWVSPDVKVFSTKLANPDAVFESTPNENPVFNQDNFVYVRIRNRGLQGSGMVTAKLYYADPATNLVYPADWNDGQTGIQGKGSLKVGGMGTNQQGFPNVATGAQNVLPQPYVWRPPDPNNATQTQTLPDGRVIGHFCLLVRLESADDPIIFSGGGESSVINDNNISMANQQVYSAPPAHMFHFSFFVRGGTIREGITENDLLFDLSKLPRASRVILQLEGKQSSEARLVNATRTKDGIVLKVGKGTAGLRNLRLKPDLKLLAKVLIQMPARVSPNDYPVDVYQGSSGKPVGGMRLISRVSK
jgi:hypothetical protein